MKIAYIRPYEGEVEIIKAKLPEYSFVVADEVESIDKSVLEEVEVLSVFVDYQVTKEVFDLLPNLKLVVTRSAGYDHIDFSIAQERNIPVCRVPHYGTRTVAEYAIALMFALSRNAFRAYTDMRENVSLSNLEAYEGFDLCGKTLGVVGTGAIGRNVCAIARGIGMKVVAYDVKPDETFANENGITYETLENLLSQSDLVTLHVPSIPQTFHLLDEEKLLSMKTGSFLINTARGEIVDTKALIKVLREGHLAGAGLDVLEGEHEMHEESEMITKGAVDAELWETLVANHALLDMPNVIVTPHIAFNTTEAKKEITDITISNIEAFVAGDPQNIVTP